MSSLKHKGMGPQVMTANGLHTGPVVYLNADGQWTTDFADALKTGDEDVIGKMRAAGAQAEAENLVIGAYFIDIDPVSGQPARYREKFRAQGPGFDPGHPSEVKRRRDDGHKVMGGTHVPL